jgi:hypothetical protein
MWRTLNLRDRPSTTPVTQQESSHAGNNICNLAIFPFSVANFSKFVRIKLPVGIGR